MDIHQGELISAIATPAGESGIGIVRMSGAGAVERAEAMFRAKSGKALSELGNYQACYGEVLDGEGKVVDEAICLVMRGPHSYTREDTVELYCHGGMLPLQLTLERSFGVGARLAEPGEFTKRAFLNGRLDLSQAEAVMDVIQARTRASLRAATGHLSGYFSGQLTALRQDILGLLAHLEAAIDFPEDDIDSLVTEEIGERVNAGIVALNKLLGTARTGRILREGLMTAIIGKPNVGKSRLLNALLLEERAIVTDIPGTTRDSIEEFTNIGGVPVRIIDTAGIRITEDQVERIGVERARRCCEQAQLVLAVFDRSRPLEEDDEELVDLLEGKTVIGLINKCDLPAAWSKEDLAWRLPHGSLVEISAQQGEGLGQLASIIHDKAYEGTIPGSEAGFVANEREAEALRQAIRSLEAVMTTIESGLGIDFISIDLRAAWEKLGEVTGETVDEDIIDRIFRDFCLGK